MNAQRIRLKFHHPVLDKSLTMDVPETHGKALLDLDQDVSVAAVAERLERLSPALPVEVLDVLGGTLSAARDWRVRGLRPGLERSVALVVFF